MGPRAGCAARMSGLTELPASSCTMFRFSCQGGSRFLRRVAEVARGLAEGEGVWTLGHGAESHAPLRAPRFPAGVPGASPSPS